MFYSKYLRLIKSNENNFSSTKQRISSLIRQFCDKSDGKEKSNLDDTSVSKLLDEATTFTDVKNAEWSSSPYPDETLKIIENKSKRPKIVPSDTSIIMFPGQGIIRVGDIENYLEYPRVHEMFAIANDILGYDLLKICQKGPQKLLNQTEYNQPATVVTSLAALEKLNEDRPRAIESCVAVAGYSVGELAALIFSGAITFEEGIKLVAIRANAMQSASDLVPQGMLSAFCSAASKPSKVCEQAQNWALDIGAANPICKIAIYLYTQFKIFGGCDEALNYIEKNKEQLGLHRVKRLPLSGAFHTKLMEPALNSFSKAVRNVNFVEPNVNVYSNYSANPYTNSERLFLKNLTKQIVAPVRWEQIIHKLYSRPQGEVYPRTFDLGSRGTMKQILKMTNLKAAGNCHVY